jgi:citrate synthase
MLRTETLPTLEKPEIGAKNTMSTSTIANTKGLEGVVAASSGVCYIDGDAGVLAYRGIDIHELADYSTFEETCCGSASCLRKMSSLI